ncbi:MAG: diguanylate cyclase [Proteobacteria bacterium]|nr:diguanylate cyclase [Pseudomonadota bacterium]
MPEENSAQSLKNPDPATSLSQVLGQSERIKDIVEECADDLSSVNARLKLELTEGEVSPGVENALEISEAVEDKVQIASDELSLVNMALQDEVHERTILQEKLAAEIKQGDKARHASLHDPLTGLPNRALFNDRLEHGLAHAKRNGHSLVVMFVDLDDFKRINDTHGHDVGDIVLTTIAGRIKQASRDEDTVCRHGGDEFLYILAEITSERDITPIAEKIIAMVKLPCDIRIRNINIRLVVHPSIGIAIFPSDGMTAESLVANADKAMYQAKRNKSGYSLFGDLALLPD